MRFRCTSIDEGFGCIVFQDGLERETFFFFGKDQGRQILGQFAAEDEASPVVLQDILDSGLPESSEVEFMRISGRVGETISWLIEPVADACEGNPIQIFKPDKGVPLFYFMLTPHEGDQDSSIVLGFHDVQGEHFTFIFYSKEHGRDILKNYCEWLQGPLKERVHDILEEAFLPEKSEKKQIKIGEPMSVKLHIGYIMRKQGN